MNRERNLCQAVTKQNDEEESNYNKEGKGIKMFIVRNRTDRGTETDFKNLSGCILKCSIWKPGTEDDFLKNHAHICLSNILLRSGLQKTHFTPPLALRHSRLTSTHQ